MQSMLDCLCVAKQEVTKLRKERGRYRRAVSHAGCLFFAGSHIGGQMGTREERTVRNFTGELRIAVVYFTGWFSDTAGGEMLLAALLLAIDPAATFGDGARMETASCSPTATTTATTPERCPLE